MDKPIAIFDLDGTLVDSMGYWRYLFAEYLRSKGVTDVPANLWDIIKSMNMDQSAAYFIRKYGIGGTVDAVKDEMNSIMADHYRHDVPLKPGVMEYLTALDGRGVRLCVASNTSAPLVEACLGRLGVLDLFQFCISGEEVGSGKDRPDIYLTAAARLGGGPGEAAVYEDALFAIETARAAGFYIVGVYDQESDPDWKEICRLSDETIRDWERAVRP